jgi:hypothetical protein
MLATVPHRSVSFKPDSQKRYNSTQFSHTINNSVESSSTSHNWVFHNPMPWPMEPQHAPSNWLCLLTILATHTKSCTKRPTGLENEWERCSLHLGLCAVLLLFMSGDGQCYRLPQQEMVLTIVKELKRVPYILTFAAVQSKERCCICILEGHLVPAGLLLQRQTFSTKEGYGSGADHSDPTAGNTCIIVTSMNAVRTMSSAANDPPFLAASPPPSLRAGITGG